MHQFTLKRPPVQPRLGLRADNRRSYWDTYRPTTLSEVMGQDAAVDALRGFLAAPYPVALLFSGDTGTGKTSAALALANDLGVNLAADFFHVKSGGADLDTFEEIARLLRFTPWCGWRLILIDEADQATARARQLMLSMLESLPPRTVLVMTTNHPEKFDTRTRDRMVELPFVADSVEGAQRLADAIWHAETGGEDGPHVESLPGVFEAGKLSFRRVVGAMQALVRDGLRPLPALSGGSPEPEKAPAPESRKARALRRSDATPRPSLARSCWPTIDRPLADQFAEMSDRVVDSLLRQLGGLAEYRKQVDLVRPMGRRYVDDVRRNLRGLLMGCMPTLREFTRRAPANGVNPHAVLRALMRGERPAPTPPPAPQPPAGETPRAEIPAEATAPRGNPALRAILDAPLPPVRRESIRREPRKTWAKEVRALFKSMGLKGISVTAPRYSMACSIDITIPGQLAHETSPMKGHDFAECPLCRQLAEAERKIRRVVVAAFPDLDDRSDYGTDYFDSPLSIHTGPSIETDPEPDPTPDHDPDFREETPAEAIPPVSGGAPVAEAEAPPLEADESIVVVEELPAFVAMVKLAADEPRRLRSCDVDRVMLAAVQAFSLPTFNRFAAWLATIDLHETTRDKVKGWVYEADEAEAPTPPTDFPDAPTLTIAGKPYAYEAFTGPDGFRVVRLTKADGTTYDVAEGADRVTCECPHFVNRLFELQGRVLCKHVVAALAAGLVAQPDPDRHLPGDGDEDDARETFPATPDPAADPGPRIPIPARKLPPLSRPYRPDPAPETDPTPEAVFEDHGITLHEPEPIGHPCNVTTADAGAPAIGLQALVVACHGHTRPMSVEVAAHAQDASWAILGAIAELRDDRAEQEQPRPPQDSTEGADSPGISRVEQEDPPATLFGEGPRRGRLTLIQLVEAEADRFLARRNGAGKLMAQALEALAEDIRWTRAETPWEHESRLQLFDEWADENAPAEAR